jgi:hypothetical protein
METRCSSPFPESKTKTAEDLEERFESLPSQLQLQCPKSSSALSVTSCWPILISRPEIALTTDASLFTVIAMTI